MSCSSVIILLLLTSFLVVPCETQGEPEKKEERKLRENLGPAGEGKEGWVEYAEEEKGGEKIIKKKTLDKDITGLLDTGWGPWMEVKLIKESGKILDKMAVHFSQVIEDGKVKELGFTTKLTGTYIMYEWGYKKCPLDPEVIVAFYLGSASNARRRLGEYLSQQGGKKFIYDRTENADKDGRYRKREIFKHVQDIPCCMFLRFKKLDEKRINTEAETLARKDKNSEVVRPRHINEVIRRVYETPILNKVNYAANSENNDGYREEFLHEKKCAGPGAASGAGDGGGRRRKRDINDATKRENDDPVPRFLYHDPPPVPNLEAADELIASPHKTNATAERVIKINITCPAGYQAFHTFHGPIEKAKYLPAPAVDCVQFEKQHCIEVNTVVPGV